MAQQRADAAEAHRDEEVVSLKPEQAGPDTGATEGRFAHPRAMVQTLWRAGLGAVITVSHRSGKLFRRLVEKGERYQSRRFKSEAAEPATKESAARLSATERIHNLEHRIEDRLDRGRDNTLHWIGVPSWKEFEALEERVETLRHEVEGLQQQFATDNEGEVSRHL